jgi:hypothetical protein
MDIDEFIPKCKQMVVDYTNRHTDVTDGPSRLINSDKVYVVWFSKTLQNAKALLSTTLPDGMYYEVTLNGDKSEIYFDAYKKFDNIRMEV